MRSKFAFLPALLKHYSGEALLCRVRVVFRKVVAAKAANRSYKHDFVKNAFFLRFTQIFKDAHRFSPSISV